MLEIIMRGPFIPGRVFGVNQKQGDLASYPAIVSVCVTEDHIRPRN